MGGFLLDQARADRWVAFYRPGEGRQVGGFLIDQARAERWVAFF